MTYPGDFLLVSTFIREKQREQKYVTLPEKKPFPSTPEPKDGVYGPQEFFINKSIRVYSCSLVVNSIRMNYTG
jgi:hypothetical protein